MAGRGYVKVYRDALEHSVFDDDWHWRLFSWCLLKANFQPASFKGTPVPRGSFITGRIAAADELNTTPSRVYRGWQALQALGCITLKPDNNWTTITVCNYESYQCGEDDDRTTDEQPADNERTTNGQPADTIEEFKKGRMQETKKRNTPKPPSPADEEFERFWQAFPSGRKTGRGMARKAWATAVKKADAETIIAAASDYAASDLGRSEYVKGPTPWLNGECWSDDRVAWSRSNGAKVGRGVVQIPILEGEE